MQPPPIIETERLRISPLTLDDTPFIISLLNTEGYRKYIADRNVHTREDAERYLQIGPLKSYAEHGFGLCKVLLKSSNDEALWQPIGICGLLKRDYLDHPDIGFALLPEYESKGYAKESAEAVLRWAFEELRLPTIHAVVLPQNQASIKLLERLGLMFDSRITEPETGEELCLYGINRFPHIRLRTATPADAPLLRYWDTKPHVMDSDPDDDWHWETELANEPEWREQLIAEADGRPIGMVQIIDPLLEETHYWGECAPNLRAIDIWIGEESDLGKGYGTVMMRLALERCFAPPNITAVIIDPLASNTKAHRFYERIGFRFVEKRVFNDEECFVLRMERQDFVRNEAPIST